MSGNWIRLIWPLCLLGAIGCAHATRCGSSGMVMQPDLESLLPAVERGALEADTSAAEETKLRDLKHPYYALTPEQCRCLAAANSPIAKLLTQEAEAVKSAAGRTLSRDDCLRVQILHAAAAEARNRSAAAALNVYFSLAEGEARAALLAKSTQIVADAREDSQKLLDRGLEIPFDASDFDRAAASLDRQQAKLAELLAEGNHELQKLMGVRAANIEARIWPDTDLAISGEELDADDEIAQADRPELAAVRQLSMQTNGETVDVARAVVGRGDGLAGMSSRFKVNSVLHFLMPGLARQGEANVRRRQLQQQVADAQFELEQDIRAAVAQADLRREEAKIAERLVKQWDERITVLEKQQPLGQSSFAEIAQARLKRLEALGEVVADVVNWKKSLVRLDELEGRLDDGCPTCGPMDSWMIMSGEGELIQPGMIEMPVYEGHGESVLPGLPPLESPSPALPKARKPTLNEADAPHSLPIIPDELLELPSEPESQKPAGPAIKKSSKTPEKSAARHEPLRDVSVAPVLFAAPPLPSNRATGDLHPHTASVASGYTEIPAAK